MSKQKQSKDEQEKKSVIDKTKTGDKDQMVKEIGGRNGPDPVRYGDWEKDGKCVDF